MTKYIAFLRGINVSGHHKVPMAELREELAKLGFENIITLLNSGNVIFDAKSDNIQELENTVSAHLEQTFGFPIPTILRSQKTIERLLDKDPFQNIEVTKDIRLYVSFLRKEVETDLTIPWISDDESFKILDIIDNTLVSVLDISVTKTTKGMAVIEKSFGKDITTRNWNTIKRIEKKLVVD